MGPYDDIINLPHHISKKHPQLPISRRVHIFAPFMPCGIYEEEDTSETKETNEQDPETECIGE